MGCSDSSEMRFCCVVRGSGRLHRHSTKRRQRVGTHARPAVSVGPFTIREGILDLLNHQPDLAPFNKPRSTTRRRRLYTIRDGRGHRNLPRWPLPPAGRNAGHRIRARPSDRFVLKADLVVACDFPGLAGDSRPTCQGPQPGGRPGRRHHQYTALGPSTVRSPPSLSGTSLPLRRLFGHVHKTLRPGESSPPAITTCARLHETLAKVIIATASSIIPSLSPILAECNPFPSNMTASRHHHPVKGNSDSGLFAPISPVSPSIFPWSVVRQSDLVLPASPSN